MLAILGYALVVVAPARAEDSTLRLRIAWGGSKPIQWAARMSVNGGTLTDMSLLGREADTPGSLWIDAGTVLVAQPRARTFDGCDITVHSAMTGAIRLEFRAAGDSESTTVEIPLSELMTTAHRSALPAADDQSAATLLVHRVSDDALRIDLDRDDLIFTPGENLEFDMTPVVPGLEAGSAIDLAVAVFSGRGGHQEWSINSRKTLPTQGELRLPISIPLPEKEGVYTVRLTISTPPGNRAKFWESSTAEKLAERTFQVVVLEPNAPIHYRDAEWKTTLEIDPANPKWYDRLPDWTRLDRLAKWTVAPMGSETSGTATMHDRQLVELSASRATHPTWQAYPLPAAEIGLPHVVEVDLPGDFAQELAIRIYEPDADGKLVPLGPATAIVVDASTLPGTETFVSHRCLFYPRTKSPVAVVQNLSNENKARFGRIRLRSVHGSRDGDLAIAYNERPIAAYFDWNELLEHTSARTPAADGRPAVDDWQTFYLLAERLAASLELSGYNMAVVNVWRDGGAAFDAGDYPTTPVMNFSRLNTGATDLPPIDPLDLMLRICSRRGLRMVPSIRFNSSLVDVNRMMRTPQKQKWTIENYPVWTDLAGRPRTTITQHQRGSTPHYYTAHPKVAEEVQGIVDRLIVSCSGHAAFAGVSLELSADSYLAFPPSEYGVTPTRLANVAARMKVNSEVLNNWIQNPHQMLDDASARRVWHRERALATTSLLGSIATNLYSNNPEASLWLLTAEMFDTNEFSLRPQFAPRPLDELYLERGVDLAQLESAIGAEVVLPQFDVTGSPLADAARPMELSQRTANSAGDALAMWQLGRKIPAIENSAFAAASAAGRLAPVANPKQVGAGLTSNTYRGSTGPLMVGGTAGPANLADDQQRLLLRLLANIPRGAEPVGKSIIEQPVSVQAYRLGEELIMTVANDSPWSVQAKITLNVSARTTAAQIKSGEKAMPVVSYAEGLSAWPVKLSPYEVQVHRFAKNEVAATGVVVQLDPSVAKQLAKQCELLERRDLNPSQRPLYAEVLNPSFEKVDEQSQALNWLSAPTVMGGLDGERAAQLKSDGPSTNISTPPFKTPATGQAALTAHLKVVDLSEDAELRLFVEQVDSRAPPSCIRLSAARLFEDQKSQSWNAYQFGVEDLPFDSSAKLRIRFELIGKGEVLIDKVEVHDLVYPLRIYPESDQQVLALVQHVRRTRQALDAHQYRDCLNLLNSYWSQFVIEYLPETKLVPAETVAPAAPTKPVSESTSTPKLSDRVRDWFRF
ncbi:hypothetical protein [Aeoliella mucimassa]|uniref:hypothetical protein n=1 Tax=Aeoliella mucimassa TaxID=2527972 RepID=UPI0018D413BF|nr:hypothetical protein [Aeoliella mucimassa]